MTAFAGRIEARITVPAGVTLQATNSGGGPTTVTLTAGSYYLTAFLAHLQAALQAQRAPSSGSWAVSFSEATQLVTVAVTAGTLAITWVDLNLRDLLGFAGNIATTASSTGTKGARGVWIPDRPVVLDGDPNTAPLFTDARQTESPGGLRITIGGGISKHVHTSVRWEAVERHRVWIYAETTVNASFERFWRDTQRGTEFDWFEPGSLVQVYDSSNVLVGIGAGGGAGVAGWSLAGLDRFAPRMSRPPWTGAWEIEIPEIVAEGVD